MLDKRENLAQKAEEYRAKAELYGKIIMALDACKHHEKVTKRVANTLKKQDPSLVVSFQPGKGFSSPTFYVWTRDIGPNTIKYDDRVQVLLPDHDSGKEVNPFKHAMERLGRWSGWLLTAANDLEAVDLDALDKLAAQIISLRDLASEITEHSDDHAALYDVRNLYPEIW